MGTTTGFRNINIFEIPDMRSFEELLLIEAREVINIWDIYDMGWQGNPKCSWFISKQVPKKFGGGLGDCKIPRAEALVLQSCVSAVMISSLVNLTCAFPLMHLYMYISVDKKCYLLIYRVCNPKSFIKSATLVLIKSKLPVMIHAVLLWGLQI